MHPNQIVLTSFRDRSHWPGVQLSIARWNPAGAKDITRALFLAPIYNGESMVNLEPDDFRIKYEKILERNIYQMEQFLKGYSGYDLVLCCWCNPSRQKLYRPKLYCHRILIGYYIEEHYPKIKVIYADGAENPIWQRKTWHKPINQ